MTGESLFQDSDFPHILDFSTSRRSIGHDVSLIGGVTEAYVTHGRIYVEGTGLPSTAVWQLWREDTQAKVAELDVNAHFAGDPPPAGAFTPWFPVLGLDGSPIRLTSSVTTRVCRHIQGPAGAPGQPGYGYSADANAPFPFGISPLRSTTGCYQDLGDSNTYPVNNYPVYFFADLKLGIPFVAARPFTVAVAALSTLERLKRLGRNLFSKPLPSEAPIGPSDPVFWLVTKPETRWDVGQPESRWSTGQPNSRWEMGQPNGEV